MALSRLLVEKEKMKRSRLVISVGSLWWMAQVFRFAEHRGACFGPGLGRLLRYERLRAWHAMFDSDRWQWWKLRLRTMLTRYRNSN